MISRRNIRVKVMQTLYTCSTREGDITIQEAVRTLDKHVDQTRQLFVFLIHFITEVARYAERDSLHRSSKHLPTQQDLEVNTKLAGNQLLCKYWNILLT